MAISSSLTATQRKILNLSNTPTTAASIAGAKDLALKKAVANPTFPTPPQIPQLPAAPAIPTAQTNSAPAPSMVMQMVKDALQKKIAANNAGLQPMIAQSLQGAVMGPNTSQTLYPGISLGQAINSQGNQQQGLVDRAQGLLNLQSDLGTRFDTALGNTRDILQEQANQRQQDIENQRANWSLGLQQAEFNRGSIMDQYQGAKDVYSANYQTNQDAIANKRNEELLKLQKDAAARQISQDDYQKQQDQLDNQYKQQQLRADVLKSLDIDPWTGKISDASLQILQAAGIDPGTFQSTVTNPSLGSSTAMRTDRTNNPIATSVAVDASTNPLPNDPYNKEWLGALDKAGVNYSVEQGHNFGNRATITFATPADGIRGAIALLGTSAFSWYKKSTGKNALMDIAGPIVFQNLPLARQVAAVIETYSHEGGKQKSLLAKAGEGVISGVDRTGLAALAQTANAAPPVQVTPSAPAQNTVSPTDDAVTIAAITPLVSITQNSPGTAQNYASLLQNQAQDYVNNKMAGGESEQQAIREWTNVYNQAINNINQQQNTSNLQNTLAEQTAKAQAADQYNTQTATQTNLGYLNQLAADATKGPEESKMFIQAYLQAKTGKAVSAAEADDYLRAHNPLGGTKLPMLGGLPTMGLWPDQVKSMLAEINGSTGSAADSILAKYGVK